jgi:hypothetical protein
MTQIKILMFNIYYMKYRLILNFFIINNCIIDFHHIKYVEHSNLFLN